MGYVTPLPPHTPHSPPPPPPPAVCCPGLCTKCGGVDCWKERGGVACCAAHTHALGSPPCLSPSDIGCLLPPSSLPLLPAHPPSHGDEGCVDEWSAAFPDEIGKWNGRSCAYKALLPSTPPRDHLLTSPSPPSHVPPITPLLPLPSLSSPAALPLHSLPPPPPPPLPSFHHSPLPLFSHALRSIPPPSSCVPSSSARRHGGASVPSSTLLASAHADTALLQKAARATRMKG